MQPPAFAASFLRMNGRIRALAAGSAAALMIGAAARPPALPSSWREPTAAEQAEALTVARKANEDPKLEQSFSVSADFDGDGRTDRAAFLINDRTAEFRLFVRRASIGRYEPLDYGGEGASLPGYTLEVDRPGKYLDITDHEDGRERSVRTRWPGIGVTAFETSYVIFYWNGRRFDQVWLSD